MSKNGCFLLDDFHLLTGGWRLLVGKVDEDLPTASSDLDRFSASLPCASKWVGGPDYLRPGQVLRLTQKVQNNEQGGWGTASSDQPGLPQMTDKH